MLDIDIVPRMVKVALYGVSSSVSLWIAAFAYFALRRARGMPLAALSFSVFLWNVSSFMLESLSGLRADEPGFLVHPLVNLSHLAYSVFLPLLYLVVRGDGFRGLKRLRVAWVMGIPVAANILQWLFPPGSFGPSPVMRVVYLVQLGFGALIAALSIRVLLKRSRDPADVERVSVVRLLVAAAVFSALFALYRAGAFRGHGFDPSPISVTIALAIVAAGYRRLDPFTAAAENENRLRRYEFMADASQEYMSIVNRGYRYEAVNDAFCASMQRRREDIVGRRVEEVWGKAVFRETIKPSIDSCLDGSSLVYRKRFAFGDEAEKHLEVSYYPFVPAGASEPTHAVVVTKDISAYARKEAELESERRRADAANKAKSDFLAAMSHEIRTPINAVMGLTELSLRKELDAELRDDLETVRAASRNLLALVNDILDLSKIEAGGMRLERIPFSPRESLERTVKAFKPAVDKKALSLETALDPRVPELLMGDPLRFSQILFNLIGNAVKFTEKGGVSVSLLRMPKGNPSGAVGLRIEVRDTGIGIPAEKLDAIFESFSQASEGTSRKYGGSGLGLTISRRLARSFGGEVRAESTLGSGSSFFFDAYFDEAPAGSAGVEAAVPNLPDASVPNDAGGTPSGGILLVEDNPINARVALRFLRSVGKEADHAADGAEALRMLAARRYALVLMDVELPEMDGLETTRRVRAGEAGPEALLVPIVAMTAHAGSEHRSECSAAGMDDFLSKPLDFADLESVVSRFERPYARERLAGPEAAPVLSPSGGEPPILDRRSALRRLGGDEALLDELYGIFRSETAERGERILLCAETGDFAALAAAAHQIKGSAASIGADRLVFGAGALESAARSGVPGAVSAALESYLSAAALTAKALAQ